jgi:hypothetical protein
MFLGTYAIDEYVNIPAVTHRFSSGAAYAPSSITYSIYEEGNATGIDENIDMTPASPFDSIVGCYYARRQLTAAAGFENNKTYVVVIKATVDSVAAIDVHIFQIRPVETGDSYAIVNSGTYGNSALKTLMDTTGVKVASIANNAITAAAINADAITAAKIADDAFSNEHFAAGALTSAEITSAAGCAVTSIANNAITTASINDGAITNAKVADDVDVNVKTITNGAITAAAIADNAIDAATFAADVDAEILSYLVDDATRIDASALNTLSGHDPGEAIMGATDLGTGAGLTTLATAAELAKVPKSDGSATWNATALASINAEVDTALNTAIPGGPTANSINERIAALDDHVTADYTATEKAAIDLLDDANGLVNIHDTLDTVATYVDTEVAAIKVVTDALTAAAATKMALSAGTIVTGAAAAGTLSTTQMTTDLTEATDDHYNGRIIIWTSGVLQNQATDITDYDGATKKLTFTAVTEAPTAADTFIIV